MGWTIDKVNVSANETIVLIDIDEIDGDLADKIDEFLVKICEGKSGRDKEIIKIRLNEFFDEKISKGTQKAMDTVKGAIAEFFIHLYIDSIGYKQECFYLNMEEHSIKKGFDGYYSLNGDDWIMESKSGDGGKSNNTHSKKIGIAYNDLVKKFKGEVKNNPWQEAYSHAGHIDIAATSTILEGLKKLSEDFYYKKPHESKEFRIIPCGTIFIENYTGTFLKKNIKDEIKKRIEKYSYESIIAIAITQKSKKKFLDYLKK